MWILAKWFNSSASFPVVECNLFKSKVSIHLYPLYFVGFGSNQFRMNAFEYVWIHSNLCSDQTNPWETWGRLPSLPPPGGQRLPHPHQHKMHSQVGLQNNFGDKKGGGGGGVGERWQFFVCRKQGMRNAEVVLLYDVTKVILSCI